MECEAGVGFAVVSAVMVASEAVIEAATAVVSDEAVAGVGAGDGAGDPISVAGGAAAQAWVGDLADQAAAVVYCLAVW